MCLRALVLSPALLIVVKKKKNNLLRICIGIGNHPFKWPDVWWRWALPKETYKSADINQTNGPIHSIFNMPMDHALRSCLPHGFVTWIIIVTIMEDKTSPSVGQLATCTGSDRIPFDMNVMWCLGLENLSINWTFWILLQYIASYRKYSWW